MFKSMFTQYEEISMQFGLDYIDEKTFKSRNWTPSKNEWPSISLSVNSIYHHFSFVFVRACDELIHKIKAKREKEEEKKKNFIPQHTEKRSNVCLPLTKMLFYVLEKRIIT